MTLPSIDEMMALLRQDTEQAQRSIAETRAFAARHGLDLPGRPSPTPSRKTYVSGSKGKSKPGLVGWLRRMLSDGTLPLPTDRLIISDRMVKQALDQGLIVGEGHPYRITPAGRRAAGPNSRAGG